MEGWAQQFQLNLLPSIGLQNCSYSVVLVVHSALYARRLKEKLWKMTGTEEIRINDRQYTQHICSILHQRRKVSVHSTSRQKQLHLLELDFGVGYTVA